MTSEDQEPRIDVSGSASLHITEGGDTQEVNTPLHISLNQSCRWQGRPDRPAVESDSVDVRRFVRRAIYNMRPDPAPRPVLAAPKPAGTKRQGAPEVAAVDCPACQGMGEVIDERRVVFVDCDVCEGTGRVPAAIANRWRDEHP